MYDSVINLGTETDDLMLERLKEVLKSLTAVEVRSEESVVGTQNILTQKYEIDQQEIILVAETYEGVFIRGTKDLVDQIASQLLDH
jgi:hypothetical protein